MAILGNLRKNSFVLIAVIGMALFAFVIAGVFDGSGFQSPDPIGQVNGEELSIIENYPHPLKLIIQSSPPSISIRLFTPLN